MTNETAMAAALRKAGFNSGLALHAVIAEIIQQSKGSARRGSQMLWKRLCDSTEVRQHAMSALIAAVAIDMKGIPKESQLNLATDSGHEADADLGSQLPGEDQLKGAERAMIPVSSARLPIGGEGHPGGASNGQSAHADTANPIANGDVQESLADQAREKVTSVREPSLSEAARVMRKAQEPSKMQLSAARRVQAAASRTIWDRTIGGEICLRSSTKMDWINFARKFHSAGHVCNRMITEIAWIDDDKTPLEKVATEEKVREIIESGPRSLMMLEHNHA